MMRNIINKSDVHNVNVENFPNPDDFVCSACATGESAFTPKWCFGVMTMWLVGLMTGVKDLSHVICPMVGY